MSIPSQERILAHVDSTSSEDGATAVRSHTVASVYATIRFGSLIRCGRRNAWNEPADATPRSLKIAAEPSIAARIANSPGQVAMGGVCLGAAQERGFYSGSKRRARAALIGAAGMSNFYVKDSQIFAR